MGRDSISVPEISVPGRESRENGIPESPDPAPVARIKDRGLAYWADPGRKKAGEINRWDDGRGVYFDDPDGRLLEILTRPYGSGGTSAEYPHPLVAETITPK